MEIENGSNAVNQIAMQGAAKVAGGKELKGVERVQLPKIEAKAAPEKPEFKASDLDKAVADLQAFVDRLDRDLSFRRDESIDRAIITVRDANTNQLVRQIPAEEVVEIARQIKQDLDARRAGMLIRGEV